MSGSAIIVIGSGNQAASFGPPIGPVSDTTGFNINNKSAFTAYFLHVNGPASDQFQVAAGDTATKGPGQLYVTSVG